MASQVREFQAAHGLPADGVAGPQTLMLLNEVAAAIHEPHLHSPAATTLAAAAAPEQ
jgi:murein L,D-transpeptidase YcbB/YkuD